MAYVLRLLEEKDWRIFSEIRLRALATDPGVFGSNFEAESKFTESDWRNQLANKNCGIFGVFNDENIVGMSGVVVDRNDLSGKTALLWGSWLEPEARKRGLSRLMYSARIRWARERPSVCRIIVSHRESNLSSKYANQKFDFVQTRVSEREWPDGKTEKEFHYELTIKDRE